MKGVKQFYNALDKFPHIEPVNAIWAQIYPCLGVWVCSLFTIFFALDFIYHAVLREIEQESDPNPVQDTPPLRPYLNPSRPATLANKVIAFTLASLSLLANLFWFTQAVVNYPVEFYCVEDPRWNDQTNIRANVGDFLSYPIDRPHFCVAQDSYQPYPSALGLVLVGRSLASLPWTPPHPLGTALPVVIVVLVPFSLTMLFVGRSLDDVKERVQNELQWMDGNIRRGQGQELETSAWDERNTAEGFGRSDEEQPLLGSGGSYIRPYVSNFRDSLIGREGW